MAQPVSGSGSLPPASGARGRLLRAIGERTAVCFRVVFADGSSFQNREGDPAFTLAFRSAAAQRRTLLFGHVGLLESYFDQSLDFAGDTAAAFRAGMDASLDARPNPLNWVRNQWHELRLSNRSVAQAKANARFHYGLGTEFYCHGLDLPYLMYTRAYWKEGTTTIEQAQQNKMEHVCRKLLFKFGDTFADVGCGWGGFTFYAWERSRALGAGVNTAPEQVEAMREEVARRGLGDKIRVIEADFREIPGEYDKCVSIGVLEHAGRDQLAEVVRAHARSPAAGFPVSRKRSTKWKKPVSKSSASRTCGAITRSRSTNGRGASTGTGPRSRRSIRSATTSTSAASGAPIFIRAPRCFRSPNGRPHLFQITCSNGNTDSQRYPMSRTYLYAGDLPS
jgi:hypothetical protein